MKPRTPFYTESLSLNKDSKSPYWMVTFRGPDGKLKRRSTKVPHAGGMFEGSKISASRAQTIAYQRAVQLAAGEKEKYERENNVSVRDWCEAYITRHAGHLSLRTVNNARTAYKFLYMFLGQKADAPLRLLTKSDLKNFVAKRREQVRFETVKKDLAAISQALKDAVDSEVIDKNPCSGIAIPADRAGEKRIKEAFTLEEIQYMIEKFPPLWSSAVRCAFETFGQRLGDILRLNWEQFDWQHRCVHFVTGKTGRILMQPMRDSFYAWAHAKWQNEGCPKTGLLHGDLLALGDKASYEFGLLLRAHKLGMLHGSYGGRRRTMNTKSFHSIRATCATLLHTHGVTQSLAMELVGHESANIHRVYVRPTSEQLRAAANVLPEL